MKTDKYIKEDNIVCTDGLMRSQEEYDEWITTLGLLYESKQGDLTPEDLQALKLEGIID